MGRQPTPDYMDQQKNDVLGELMNGGSSPSDGKQENQQAIKQVNNNNQDEQRGDFHREEQENNKKIKLPKNKATKQDNDMEIIELKEKATFNLSQSTLLKLEDAWIKLRRQLKGEQRVTKTAIVEMALEICIEELAQKETESTLYKGLAES